MSWMMRRAAKLLLFSTLLGSLLLVAGCAERLPELPPAPRIMLARDCPAPERPDLPPFDAPENVSALMRRDAILKRYAEGLEAAVDCYHKAKKEDSDARGTDTTVD